MTSNNEKKTTLEELLNNQNLNEVRLILKSDLNAKFESEYYALLNNNFKRALPIGRCFLSNSLVKDKLKKIVDNCNFENRYRLQAIYELLEDRADNISTNEILSYKKFVIDNIQSFEGICKDVYGDIEDYFTILSDKIMKSSLHKRWLYAYEMVVLYKDDANSLRILNEYCIKDEFLNNAIDKLSNN